MNRRSFLVSAVALGASVAAAGAAQASGAQFVVDAPWGLNLRTGPGNGYKVIKVMTNGEKVEILAASGKWRKVRHKHSGKVGWAHGAYLVS